MAVSGHAAAQAPEVLTLTGAETAQIDGRDWERTGAGGTMVDAVHRTVLIRFPGSADAIRPRLNAGLELEKAEITLHYARHETRPQGYTLRDGLGIKAWTENPPRWHVVGQALRQPWAAHGTFGPTTRYRVRLVHPWAKAGAADPAQDRWPEIYGPAELSQTQPTARLDVTALINGTAAAGIGERLRRFEDNGLALSKLPEDLFRAAVNEDISLRKAVIIGESGLPEPGMRMLGAEVRRHVGDDARARRHRWRRMASKVFVHALRPISERLTISAHLGH
jgi:hypothetical protein